MKHLFTIFTILIAISFSVQSQTIKGCIVDADHRPVEYATVVLQTPDSIYINSVMTDSLGCFAFQSSQNPYRLIIQHLLYNTKESLYHSADIGNIVLDNSPHTLDEITVKGYRPAVTVANGKLTYDMPRLLENKAVSNAYESILQLPGVREQDGKIILAGTNGITIILNGKPSTMSIDQLIELLKNTPQTRIIKAEIMYSAPPQYHVRGAAINLILDGGITDQNTFQGQFNSSYSQRTYERVDMGLTLVYSTPKFSTDFMYNINNGRNITNLDLDSKHSYNGSLYDIQQSDRGKSHFQNHNIRIGSEYKISDQDKLSLTYTSKLNTSYNSTLRSYGTFSDSKNHKTNESPGQMHNIALSYTSHFGLSSGIDYTYYKDNTIQNFIDNKNDANKSFISMSSQKINRLKLYADQSHDLSNSWTLNYGGAFTFASDNGSQTYSNKSTDQPLTDTQNRLKEYTYNFYSGFEKSFGEKVSLSASIAGEYYKLGDFSQWSVFPTLEMTYMIAPEHVMQLSLSSDKSYPDYWEMHGAVSYLNGYTEIHGNPYLRPSKDYNLRMNYIFRSKYTFSLYTSYEDDYFVQLPYQASDRLALIYKTTNFDFQQSLGASLSAPFTVGSWLNTRLDMDGFYTRSKNSNFNDISFDNSKWALYSSLNNTINISSKPNIKAELSAAYLTPIIQGPGNITRMWRIDAGVKWSFAGDKAELKLKAFDIFKSWNPKMRLQYSTQNIKMHPYQDSRYLTVSFSYKFGGYKAKERKDVDTSRFGQQ